MKNLEERQKELDAEHTGLAAELNMEQYKYGRPARPSAEMDQFYEDAIKPSGNLIKHLEQFKTQKL